MRHILLHFFLLFCSFALFHVRSMNVKNICVWTQSLNINSINVHCDIPGTCWRPRSKRLPQSLSALLLRVVGNCLFFWCLSGQARLNLRIFLNFRLSLLLIFKIDLKSFSILYAFLQLSYLHLRNFTESSSLNFNVSWYSIDRRLFENGWRLIDLMFRIILRKLCSRDHSFLAFSFPLIHNGRFFSVL